MEDFLAILDSKGFLTKGIDEIKGEEGLEQFFTQEKKKGVKKSSEERAGEYCSNKCQARIWKEGYDNIQCEHPIIEGCYCKRHANKVKEHGEWWLGLITDERPEEPIHYNGTKHTWKKDKNGNENQCKVCDDGEGTQKVKRKRGRPKGSKNKKKKEEKNTDEYSTDEILALISQKEKEKDELMSENTNTYKIDGFSYFKNEDGTILDTSDFSLIGTLDEENNFTFANSESEEKHKLNIQN